MLEYQRDLRGIPLWLVKEYLLELGGRPEDQDDHISGPGWSVHLSQIESFQVGSLVVCQIRLEIQVEPDASAAFQEALDKKLLRAGG